MEEVPVTLEHGWHVTHARSSPWRYWSAKELAKPPSPTVEATLLTMLERTSPTAHTPGAVVSSSDGGRAAVHCPVAAPSAPVSTKPRGSRAISTGSQSVEGSAPIN